MRMASFLLLEPQASGFLCGSSSTSSHLTVENQFRAVQRWLTYTKLRLEISCVQGHLTFYIFHWTKKAAVSVHPANTLTVQQCVKKIILQFM